MGILDIIIIALLLIHGIMGLKKGILRQLGGIISIVGGILVCIFLYKTVTDIACGMSFYNNIYVKVSDFAVDKLGDSASYTISALGEEGFDTALKGVNFPSFLTKLFKNSFATALVNTPDITLGEYFGDVLSTLVMTVIVCAVLFLVTFLILKLIFRGLTKLSDNSAVGTINRLLGMIWGLVKASITICIAMAFISSLTTMNSIGDAVYSFISSDMKLEQEGFGLAKFFYQQNPLLQILSKFGLENLISFNFTKEEILILGVLK